jgi:hypothetical protein
MDRGIIGIRIPDRTRQHPRLELDTVERLFVRLSFSVSLALSAGPHSVA